MSSWSRRWVFESSAGLRAAIKALAALDIIFKEGKPYEIIIRLETIEKTASQRGAFHALIEEFANAVGMTPKEMKETIRREYYGSEWKTLQSGHRYEVFRSTEDEDHEGYGRLISFVIQIAAENGVILEVKSKRTKGL